MTIKLRLTAVPFIEMAHIKSVNNHYIKIEPKRRLLKFAVQSEGRKRIVLDICNFFVKTVNDNPTRFIDSSKIEPTLRAWFNKICLHSFKNYADDSQAIFEADAISEGRSLILEAVGLAQHKDLEHEEIPAPTPPEELVAATADEKLTQCLGVNTIRLPLWNGRQVELVIPNDLTPAEADLIANASLEYFKHLILTQYKK